MSISFAKTEKGEPLPRRSGRKEAVAFSVALAPGKARGLFGGACPTLAAGEGQWGFSVALAAGEGRWGFSVALAA